MHAAIHLPHFALQAVLRLRPQAKRAAVAVLEVSESPSEERKADQQRLLHVNAEAERHGIHAGMAAGMAMARCAPLVLLHRNGDAEHATQNEVLECAAQWTPDYETTAPGLCVLDVSRIHDLSHRLEACGRSIHAHLASRNLQARIGFAPGADLAVLAAHAATPVLVWRDAEADGASYLRALPLSVLSPAPETAELLRLWGIRTLGELVKLPRQEVTLRLGREGKRLWDMAAGGRERLLRLFRPALRYREERELEHGVESLEPLLFLLRRMLDVLCLRLAESWQVAAAMKLELGFDDKQRREASLRIAEPTRDVDLLLRLLHTHMEGVTAPAPIICVALELTPTRPAGSQMHIFERGMRDPNRFAETLAQIEAVVGNGNAGRVKLLPSRALDAFEITPYLDEALDAPFAAKPQGGGTCQSRKAGATPWVQGPNRAALKRRRKMDATRCAAPSGLDLSCVPQPRALPWAGLSQALGLPLRRIRPVRPVDVTLRNGSPAELHTSTKNHVITRCSGPWLVSGEWWGDARWQREVWEVETNDGVLYQLTRHNGQWQLEGVFG
jgi:protein ImuB